MFISWKQISVTQRHQLFKEVDCESCATPYVYALTLETYGSGTSLYGLDNEGARQRALTEAQNELATKRKTECKVVPCPNCGWIQKHMFAEARQKHWEKNGASKGAFIFYGFAGMIALLTIRYLTNLFPRDPIVSALVLSFFCLLIATAFFIGILARIQNRRWNPNTESVEARMARGKKLSVDRQEYLEWLAAEKDATPE